MSIKETYRWGGILGTCLFILWSCQSSQPLINQNMAEVYKISETSPLPFYTLYQYTSDSIQLHFSIPSRVPMLEQINGKPTDALPYQMHVRVYQRNNRDIITDSATFHYESRLRSEQTEIHGSIRLFTGEPVGKNLSISIHDISGNTYNHQYYELIAAWPPGRYHFLVSDSAGQPITNNHLMSGHPFFVESSILQDQEIMVRYYRDSFPVALPPFALLPSNYLHLSYEADSIFPITFEQGKTKKLIFNQPGIYHFSSSPDSRKGYTLFVSNSSFPWITTPLQMVYPLRYIATDKEYDELLSASDLKTAVDKFWIDRTGNEARARKLIREYYRRVEKSNYLFTSHQEGWQTDRGMIYIMYGPPGLVERDGQSEVWIYGDSKNIFNLSFVFSKMNNPFSDNDFLLERSANYKSGWHQMVNSWRR